MRVSGSSNPDSASKIFSASSPSGHIAGGGGGDGDGDGENGGLWRVPVNESDGDGARAGRRASPAEYESFLSDPGVT